MPPSIPRDAPCVTDPQGINARGDMIGQVTWLNDLLQTENNVIHGWFFNSAKLEYTVIDPPFVMYTWPMDIGVYLRPDGQNLGFLRKPDGTYADILPPTDWRPVGAGASAINSEGVIVGSFVGEDFRLHGFVLKKGVYTAIDPPDADESAPYGINTHPEAVTTLESSLTRARGGATPLWGCHADLTQESNCCRRGAGRGRRRCAGDCGHPRPAIVPDRERRAFPGNGRGSHFA
jgi:hypothetical protein